MMSTSTLDQREWELISLQNKLKKEERILNEDIERARLELKELTVYLADIERARADDRHLLDVRRLELENAREIFKTSDCCSMQSIKLATKNLNKNIGILASCTAECSVMGENIHSAATEQISSHQIDTSSRWIPGNELSDKLQTDLRIYLTGVCENLINGWSPYEDEHDCLETVYESVIKLESLGTARKWRAMTMQQLMYTEEVRRDISGIVVSSLLAVLREQRWSEDAYGRAEFAIRTQVPPLVNEMNRLRLKLRTGIISADVRVFSARPEEPFDGSSMVGITTEARQGTKGVVLGSIGLGLKHHHVEQGDIVMKTPVIVAT